MVRRPAVALSSVLSSAVLLLAAPAAGRAQPVFGQTFAAPGTPAPVLRSLTAPKGNIVGPGTGGGDYVATIYAYDVAAGAAVGPRLFAQALGPSFDGFSLALNLPVRPGAVYGLFFEGGSAEVFGTFGPDYADGALVSCTGNRSACAPVSAALDVAGFAVTFGPATTVPEPATWALLGTGLAAAAGVSGMARRRAHPA